MIFGVSVETLRKLKPELLQQDGLTSQRDQSAPSSLLIHFEQPPTQEQKRTSTVQPSSRAPTGALTKSSEPGSRQDNEAGPWATSESVTDTSLQARILQHYGAQASSSRVTVTSPLDFVDGTRGEPSHLDRQAPDVGHVADSFQVLPVQSTSGHVIHYQDVYPEAQIRQSKPP